MRERIIEVVEPYISGLRNRTSLSERSCNADRSPAVLGVVAVQRLRLDWFVPMSGNL